MCSISPTARTHARTHNSLTYTIITLTTTQPYVQADDRHTYQVSGVVWRTLFKKYERNADTRVVVVMKAMFVSPKQAKLAKLPIDEVSKK